MKTYTQFVNKSNLVNDITIKKPKEFKLFKNSELYDFLIDEDTETGIEHITNIFTCDLQTIIDEFFGEIIPISPEYLKFHPDEKDEEQFDYEDYINNEYDFSIFTINPYKNINEKDFYDIEKYVKNNLNEKVLVVCEGSLIYFKLKKYIFKMILDSRIELVRFSEMENS